MDELPGLQDPSLAEWLSWPAEEIARWISSHAAPVVMGWPYNGTRRWYLARRSGDLDHSSRTDARDYMTTLIRRQAEHHRMVFAHGVSVLLAPCFGAETLKRGAEYTRYALGGLLKVGEDAVYREMFSTGVRIRFYGDYEAVLQDTLDPEHYGPILESCARLTEETSNGSGPMLLLGLFVDDHYPAIARISVEFAKTHGRIPSRREMVEAYYGVEVPDLGFYLGFQEPQLFDVPLVCNGLEHLYATLNPSPDLTERQLREILYDHLLARAVPPVDYESLSPRTLQRIASENELYTGSTIGLGQVDALTGLWKPKLPGDC
jgi:adenosine tuberculosinyltransferase